jgi:DnaJ family protein A protein 2
MSRFQYYEELEITKEASLEEIKKSYRRLALLHHPDRGGDTEKFKKISQAYEVLSDNQKRQNYDINGTEEEDLNAFSNIDPSEIFSMFFGRGFKDIVMELRGPKKSPNVTNDLFVSLEHIYKGKKIKIECKRKILCKSCNAKGYTSFIKCTKCDGNGNIIKNIQIMRGMFHQNITKCPECIKGNIPDIKYICSTCNGEKIVSNSEIVEIELAFVVGCFYFTFLFDYLFQQKLIFLIDK